MRETPRPRLRETTPGLSSMGGGSVYAKGAVFVCASRRPQRAGDNAGGKTKVKVDLASRFSTRSARKFIHEQSESYTVSRSAAN